MRTVDCDVTLPCGVRLRPGTRCLLPFFAAFRAPWIHHPDEYLPERWAPDAPQRKQLEAAIAPFACVPPLLLPPSF
jgi:cytochrome P450